MQSANPIQPVVKKAEKISNKKELIKKSSLGIRSSDQIHTHTLAIQVIVVSFKSSLDKGNGRKQSGIQQTCEAGGGGES